MTEGPKLREIIAINAALIYAFCLGAIAWLTWPESAEGWRWGVISICTGLGAFGLCVQSFWKVSTRVSRDRELKQFKDKRRDPSSDTTAGDRTLEDAGIVE